MFHSSTHRQHWLFKDLEALDSARSEAHEAHMAQITNALVGAAGGPDFTSAEARVVSKRVEGSVFRFCSDRRISERVLATATAYVKRFYTHHSVLQHPSDLVVRLCVFLACKTEESNSEWKMMLGLERCARPNDVTPEMVTFIKQNEVPMMAALQFHLVVHSPMRPLKGFLLDLKTKIPDADFAQVKQKSTMTLFSWLSSDIVMLHPPSQIALAGLTWVASELKVDIDDYVVQKICGGDAAKHTQLSSTLAKIQQMAVADTTGPEPESTKDILVKFQKLEGLQKGLSSRGGQKSGRRDGDVDDDSGGSRKKHKAASS